MSYSIRFPLVLGALLAILISAPNSFAHPFLQTPVYKTILGLCEASPASCMKLTFQNDERFLYLPLAALPQDQSVFNFVKLGKYQDAFLADGKPKIEGQPAVFSSAHMSYEQSIDLIAHFMGAGLPKWGSSIEDRLRLASYIGDEGWFEQLLSTITTLTLWDSAPIHEMSFLDLVEIYGLAKVRKEEKRSLADLVTYIEKRARFSRLSDLSASYQALPPTVQTMLNETKLNLPTLGEGSVLKKKYQDILIKSFGEEAAKVKPYVGKEPIEKLSEKERMAQLGYDVWAEQGGVLKGLTLWFLADHEYPGYPRQLIRVKLGRSIQIDTLGSSAHESTIANFYIKNVKESKYKFLGEADWKTLLKNGSPDQILEAVRLRLSFL